MITQAEVKRLFHYCQITGNLIWRVKVKNIKVGYPAGTDCNGYLAVKIHYKNYYIHRLVWMWHYGEFPEDHTDHIDRVKHNNMIHNLRSVTNQENQRNLKTRKDSKSGCTGVIWYKGKWIAQIKINKSSVYLGSFKEEDLNLAIAARKQAESNIWEIKSE